MTAATDRRYTAIRNLTDDVRFVAKDNDGPLVIWTKQHADRAEVATAIRALSTLGRTDRWRSAIEAWATEVETSTEETYRWAFDQFGIFASYAAE